MNILFPWLILTNEQACPKILLIILFHYALSIIDYSKESYLLFSTRDLLAILVQIDTFMVKECIVHYSQGWRKHSLGCQAETIERGLLTCNLFDRTNIGHGIEIDSAISSIASKAKGMSRAL